VLKRATRPNGFVEPCIPSPAYAPPSGLGWAHEIKHDGYRLIIRRDGDSVRLFTRPGYDWSARFPVIAEAAAKLCARTVTIDGEAVVCGPDGVAVFDALHSERRLGEAFLYAFDLVEHDGEDLRSRPFTERKARLSKLLTRQPAASSSMITSKPTVPLCSRLHAAWASRGLSRSASTRLSVGPVARLDQDQAPRLSGGAEGRGGAVVTARRSGSSDHVLSRRAAHVRLHQLVCLRLKSR
jgi:hypothetical protein